MKRVSAARTWRAEGRGAIERRRLKSATVRRLLFMSFYKFAQLVGHRSLCDGSEKLPEGEEFTTMACTFWCVNMCPRPARGCFN